MPQIYASPFPVRYSREQRGQAECARRKNTTYKIRVSFKDMFHHTKTLCTPHLLHPNVSVGAIFAAQEQAVKDDRACFENKLNSSLEQNAPKMQRRPNVFLRCCGLYIFPCTPLPLHRQHIPTKFKKNLQPLLLHTNSPLRAPKLVYSSKSPLDSSQM